VIDKITWQKAGGITQPGRYMYRFGWLTVTADDLAIWKQYPQAMFTLLKLPSADEAGMEEFHLGSFELPITDSHHD
jgi:hypothetical protein